MKVEVYSDVACPWCWIGKHRFERALAAFPAAGEVDVVYRPYQLDPTIPPTPEPLLAALERKFGPQFRAAAKRVTETGRAEGLAFDFEGATAANTFRAHRLLRLAEREHGPAVQRALVERLFAAHFAGGADVADLSTLAAIAADAGLDRARVETYLASDEGVAELRAELEEARALGVTAVPTFVFDGRYAVSGAQPASVFLQVLEQVAREREAGGVAAADEEDADACADGSCAT